MSATQRYTGQDLWVGFVYSGGTVVLSGDQNSLDVTYEARVADLTAGADVYAYEKPTVKSLGATLNTKHTGTSGSATFGALDVGTEGSLLYGPKGTATGMPKGGFLAYLKSKSLSTPFDNAVTRSYAFGPQGGVYGTTVFDPDLHTW